MYIVQLSNVQWVVNSRRWLATGLVVYSWILAVGTWEDTNNWVDTAFWNDGV